MSAWDRWRRFVTAILNKGRTMTEAERKEARRLAKDARRAELREAKRIAEGEPWR